MKLLLLAVITLYQCNAVPKAAQNLLDRQNDCPHPKMPGFKPIPGFKDPLGLPCDMKAIDDARNTNEGLLTMLGYFFGLVYMFSGLHLLRELFWKPSWNALLSFIGMGVKKELLDTDHYPTFANCIAHFYVCVFATIMTRSTIGISILVGACAIEIWVIAGFSILFNPGGAKLNHMRFDLFKDIAFHAASIGGFFFFTGFMEPPEAILAKAEEAQAAAAALTAQGVTNSTSLTGDATADAAAGVAAAALGEVDVAEWFLVLGMFALWVSYTLLVILETCCCTCLEASESEQNAEAEKGDEENQKSEDYPAVPKEENGDVVDNLMVAAGDAPDPEAKPDLNRTMSLWVMPDGGILTQLKWVLLLPFMAAFTFTIPNFRDGEEPGHYADIAWIDIFKVLVSAALSNLWMILLSIVVVQWGCIIGAVLDFEYDVVGLIVFAAGLSFDTLMESMYCDWSDDDTAFQLSEGFAAQVNNFTFTLGTIMTIYMIQNEEQMPIYDGLRIAMVLLALAAVALFVFLFIRDWNATPVLGCLMVEFGIVVCGGLVLVVYEKPDFHMTWN